MGVEFSEATQHTSVERRDEDQQVRERWNAEYDNIEENESDEALESWKHRGKDKSRSGGRREEKEHRSRDRERSKVFENIKENKDSEREKDKDRTSSRDRRKEDKDEREKDKVRDKIREKDPDWDKLREKEKDKERRDHLKEKERERDREKELEKDADRGRDKERVKEKSRDKDREKEKEKDRVKDKEREKYKDKERERENGRHRGKDTAGREKGKERDREKEKLPDEEKDRVSDRDRSSRKQKDESYDMRKDGRSRFENDHTHDHASKQQLDKSDDKSDSKILDQAEKADNRESSSQLEQRISKMKEQRLKKSSEGAPEILSWVNKSRKIEEKRNAEKEKALQLSKSFEEQDNMNDEGSEDELATEDITRHLDGVKVLHGLDKVLEGGAVVLTLKDQSILADGDINQEVDMLENVEIGEQKRRNDAYKAAKKKGGVYDDKFNDDPSLEKKMLPQYDDPITDQGLTLDSSGHFSGEAERKLEELRRRIQGVSASSLGEDLNSIGKTSSDYYTQEEMTKFKKPTKKKKSLRKKEKLDINALEAEAKAAGLGVEDLGSRNDGRQQIIREEQDRIEAETRMSAYNSALAKADEASKALRLAEARTMQTEEDSTPTFDDDDDELRKSLERARRIALKKQGKDEKSGPMVIKLLASSNPNESAADNNGEEPENKVVFTEMEEFVWGLQLDEEEKNPESEDVFMEEDVAPSTSGQEMMDVDGGGWTDIQETTPDENHAQEREEEVAPDETIREPAVGKGLASALQLLKGRGTLKETIEWGGRNMDKKKSKLVGIVGEDATKEIRIERTDEYGRILTPKEAFRLLSHKFHGKGPGKMKQEKRMRQYQDELKIKQMKNADTPSLSVERMREAQAKLKAPYLVLSGNVKHGQSGDPRSGFATVERDLAGGLTPMLGDKKVEHFLNIKRKAENGDSSSQKKPKTQ